MTSIDLPSRIPEPVVAALQAFVRRIGAVYDPDGERDGQVSAAEMLAVVDGAVAVVAAMRST